MARPAISHAFPDPRDSARLTVLSILIVLVPVEAADALLDGLFASFAGTRNIFLRRYLLGPGLKFGVVVLLLWMKSTILFLAYGYLAAGAVGVLIYGIMLIKLLREQRLLQRFRLKEIDIPARETLAFVLPGLVSALALCICPVNAFLLGRLRTMSDVAFYRAAGPISELNNIVFTSFTLLFTPLAARLFARADYRGLNGLYWADGRVDVCTDFSHLRCYLFARKASDNVPLRGALRTVRSRVGSTFVGQLFQRYPRLQSPDSEGLQEMALCHPRERCDRVSHLVVSTALIKQYGTIGAAIGSAVTLIGITCCCKRDYRRQRIFTSLIGVIFWFI